MNISVVWLASYTVAISATLILSAYFFREYYLKKLRTSLAWAVGLLLYAVSQLGHVFATVYGEITLGKPVLVIVIMPLALTMTLFYYGTSVLFFKKGSFFRERVPIILLLIYVIYLAIIIAVLPEEGFAAKAAAPIELGVILPIFLVIAILFYRLSRRIPVDDPSKRIVFIVSLGWFMASVDAFYLALFMGSSTITDSLINIVHAIAWILILYGMALGKAAKI